MLFQRGGKKKKKKTSDVLISMRSSFKLANWFKAFVEEEKNEAEMYQKLYKLNDMMKRKKSF